MSEFFKAVSSFEYCMTQSNVESLDLLMDKQEHTAAIIPTHLSTNAFSSVYTCVEDSSNNQTSFICIQRDLPTKLDHVHKAWMILKPYEDKLGLLYNLLELFKLSNINLTSIMSRPNLEQRGSYHFFLEFSVDNLSLQKIESLNREKHIKLLGLF